MLPVLSAHSIGLLVRRSKAHPVFPGRAMRMSVRSSYSARVRRAVVLLKEPPSTDATLPRDRCVYPLSGTKAPRPVGPLRR